MESFVSLLQKNVLHRQRWQRWDERRLAIVIWIEKTYHRRYRLEAVRASRDRRHAANVRTSAEAGLAAWTSALAGIRDYWLGARP